MLFDERAGIPPATIEVSCSCTSDCAGLRKRRRVTHRLARAQVKKRRTAASPRFVRLLIETTSRQQQAQRTLLGWQRVEYGIEKPSNKLLALAELDSNIWVSEVKRIRGKKQPLSSAGLHALRDEYTRTIEPARALAAETLTLERTLSGLVNQAHGLTPAEIALMGQTASPRMPIPPPEA